MIEVDVDAQSNPIGVWSSGVSIMFRSGRMIELWDTIWNGRIVESVIVWNCRKEWAIIVLLEDKH